MPERIKTRFDDDGEASHDFPQPAPKRAKLSKNNDADSLKTTVKSELAPKGKPEAQRESIPATATIADTGIPQAETQTSDPVQTLHQGPAKTTNGGNAPKRPQFSNAFQGKLRQRAQDLLKTRQKLPIWSQKDVIQSALKDRHVMLLVGETGSGKSTQVPQFLVDEAWCQRRKLSIEGKIVRVGGCIAITEPRRVAAVSLARRVAEEVGTPLGSSSPASTVGYNVRFDNSTSPNTRIKFLTEGMLLQEMLRDPWLRQYSAIVVDEVHERNVNVDLILGFLRNIATGDKAGRGGIPLKMAVMSATADLEGLERFFHAGYANVGQETKDAISICHIKGRQFPVKTLYAPSPVHDIVDAALRMIFQINFKEPLPGDILVFLTGQETVESLSKLVNDYSLGLKKEVPKLLALPLFAALSQFDQQRVFQPAPFRTRKVIIATNIAETSVTVPSVRHVIDCGKSKLKHFRTQLGLESLLCKPISQSAATQRKGRAGREAAGTCYRLYTESAYNELDKASTPEILRCDVAQALLTMKARGVQEPWAFPLLDPPPRESLEKGLLQLLELGALDPGGEISEVGIKIAKLPLSAPLGCVLLASTEDETDCLAEVIDIISCLSVEAIFNQPNSEEAREKAENARSVLLRREGDHLTLLAAMQAYTTEQSDRKAWCVKHMISHRAMKGAWDVRKQLRSQVRLMGYAAALGEDGESNDAPSPAVNNDDRAMRVLKCFLKGFGGRTALLCPDGAYRTVVGRHEISIHPSSVLFGRKVEGIVYNEFVFTNRSYARGVSAVQADWIAEVVGSKAD